MSDYYNLDQEYILNVYKRMPIELSHGEGSYLYDVDDKKYLDMFAGIAVNALGYNHPAILDALDKQGHTYLHLSNYFTSRPLIDLAKLLVEQTNLSKVFFANSGTEANEAAIKLSRKYGKLISDEKYELVSLSRGFHGRTMGSLSLTANEKYQASFLPLLPGVKTVQFNDVEDLEKKVSKNTCAFFIETLQGEGGIVSMSEKFIHRLVELSKRYDFLIVADEIQTGIYRTGKFFSYQHTEMNPDIVTSAKALGGGLPLGAMIVSKKLEKILNPGEHGTTFGGSPLSAALGKALIEELMKEDFQRDFQANILYLSETLDKLMQDYPHIIKEVRGLGMMRGLEVSSYADTIKQKSIEKGLLINVTSLTVIRLLPPLTISKEEIDEFNSILREVFQEL